MEVATLEASGLDIGEKNHSRMFAAEMTDHFYNGLSARLDHYLQMEVPGTGKPTPFTIMADKMTQCRRTQQIAGMMTYIDGKVQDLFLDTVPVKNHTGVGVAQSLHENLLKRFPDENIRSRFVGGAFDGQYHILGVPDHLLTLMNVNDQDKPWYSFHWDPAHILELAEKNSKAPSASPWVQDVENTIKNINKVFGYGKRYEELLDTSGGTALKPNSFSDTRFASYAANSMKNFLNNYPHFYDRLDSTQDNLLNTVNNSNFVLKAAALTDVYTEMGKLSRKLQKTDNFPWHVDAAVEKHTSRLNAMADSLLTPDSLHSEFKHYSQAMKEISGSSEYKGKPVFISKQSTTSSRSQSKDATVFQAESNAEVAAIVGQNVSKFVSEFTKNLNKRYEEASCPASKMAGEIFDIKKVLQRDGTPPPLFNEYTRLAKANSYIPEEQTPGDLNTQYNTFSKVVQEAAKDERFLESEGELKKLNEKKLYTALLNSETCFKDCKDIGHLLLGSMLRTNCEAVVEGMGSVLDRRLDMRSNLGQSRIEKEMFIAWNGPPPTRAADPLIRMSLDQRFGGPDKWDFVRRKDRPDKLKVFDKSKVVDRMNNIKGKLPF